LGGEIGHLNVGENKKKKSRGTRGEKEGTSHKNFLTRLLWTLSLMC